MKWFEYLAYGIATLLGGWFAPRIFLSAKWELQTRFWFAAIVTTVMFIALGTYHLNTGKNFSDVVETYVLCPIYSFPHCPSVPPNGLPMQNAPVRSGQSTTGQSSILASPTKSSSPSPQESSKLDAERFVVSRALEVQKAKVEREENEAQFAANRVLDAQKAKAEQEANEAELAAVVEREKALQAKERVQPSTPQATMSGVQIPPGYQVPPGYTYYPPPPGTEDWVKVCDASGWRCYNLKAGQHLPAPAPPVMGWSFRYESPRSR